MTASLNSASRVLNTGLFVIAMTLAFALTPIIGADLEGAVFPVLKDMKMTSVQSKDPARVAFDVSGTKVRTCRFIEVRALILSGNVWVKGDFEFAVPSETLASRPVGSQSFGVWTIKPVGAVARFEAVHECHAAWNTVSNLGAWEVK